MIVSHERPLVLLGAGGHAKVLLSLLRMIDAPVLGVCDPQLVAAGLADWRGLAVLGGDDYLATLSPTTVGLVNGIGQVVGGTARASLFQRFKAAGFFFPSLIHPAASIAAEACLSEGVQVMAGSIIQADASIGDNSIINTCASIDHDCCVGEHVHVAPGATVCGGVRIGNGAFVASGATVIQGLEVGPGAVIGAGCTLIRNLPAHHVFLGLSARQSVKPINDAKGTK